MGFWFGRHAFPSIGPATRRKSLGFPSSSGRQSLAVSFRQMADREEVKMDDQSSISEIGKLFAKWCESQASADGAIGFDDAELNAIRDQIRQLERDVCASPPTSPQDV
jgi:hypothetical protein